MNANEEAGTQRFAPLAELNRIIRENRIAEYRSPTLSLGMRPQEFASGSSKWSWPTQPDLVLNAFGTLHGGFIAVFIDELFSTAIASLLEQGEWAVTAEVKISHLRPLRPGSISGAGRVLRRGRGVAFLEADILGADGQMAVRGSSTWSISR